MLHPKLGENARNNGHVIYSLGFEVTPHQLRHTYITNLLLGGVDVKTVQVLAGHEHAKITLDIYAHLTYNQPKDLISKVKAAFANSPK
ncbi:MAG TPA: tyrosine-type recombinase/integrase [Candidatus Enterenecus merdae]|nr:tyrosine-type recombinase/integrase [Candidatus Enterenecus merdae]